MSEHPSDPRRTSVGLWRYSKDPDRRAGKYMVLHRGDGSPLAHPHLVIGAMDPAAPAALRAYAKAARSMAVTSSLGLPVWVVLRRDQTMPEWPFVVLHGADPMAPYALDAAPAVRDRLGVHPDYARDVRRLAAEMRVHFQALYAESRSKHDVCGATVVSMLGSAADADLSAASIEYMAVRFEAYRASHGPTTAATDPDPEGQRSP